MCLACKVRENPEIVDFTITQLVCCTRITSIPKEFTQLTSLYCYNCPNLTSIPKEFTQLTWLSCHDCPLLTSIPKKFRYRYKKDESVPFLSFSDKVKYTFMFVNKRYIEEMKYDLETQHNESYYAPDGLGAQELFDKYIRSPNGIPSEYRDGIK